MSTSSPNPASNALPGAGLRSVRPVQPRHPLGLPAGSVRALLTFMVLGMVWTLLLLPEGRTVQGIPIYLYYLMFITLVHYFSAHGNSIAGREDEPAPWHLPRGMLRFFIVLGFAGVIGWRAYTNRSGADLQPLFEDDPPFLYLPLILVSCFFAGVIVSRVINRLAGNPASVPYWYQDIQAWLAILAMLGLTVEVLVQLVINPSLPDADRIQMPHWQAFLAAVVGFYFGARS